MGRRLTADEKVRIRTRKRAGESAEDLATEFNTSVATVYRAAGPMRSGATVRGRLADLETRVEALERALAALLTDPLTERGA